MKITIERKSFVDALSVGSQMAGKAKGLSILENCKITIKGNSAIISSYDTEVAITNRTYVVDCDMDVVFCIEPKALLAILRSIKDDKVDFVLENYICEIVHKKGKQSLPYEDSDDFPSPVFDKENTVFKLESRMLATWIKDAKMFVGNNTLYPSMMGVYLYCGGGECGVAATNTEILYHDKSSNEYMGDEVGASLQVKAIDALLPMLSLTDEVEVMVGTRNIAFKSIDSMLVASRIEQPYPNFKRIIPTEHNIVAEVDKDDLLDTIKRAMLTANEQTCLLKIGINGMSCRIVSEDIMFAKKTHEECLCTSEGGSIEIGVKGNYVLNIVNLIESDKVVLRLNEPRKPIIWHDSLKDAKILMQMPCGI